MTNSIERPDHSSRESAVICMREPADGAVTIVVIPGLSGNWRQWEKVIQRLEVERPEIGIARTVPILKGPIFGGSTPTIGQLADVVAKDLAADTSRQYLLLAHSVGAFVAFELCVKLQSRIVGALVVNGGLATVAKFLNSPGREMMRRPFTCIRALQLFLLSGLSLSSTFKARIVRSPGLSRFFLGSFVSDRGLQLPEDRRRIIEESGTPKVYPALWVNRHHWRIFAKVASDIRADVSFLVGTADPLSGLADTAEMAGMIPNAGVVSVAGAGHALPTEAPDIVIDEIMRRIAAAN